MRRLLFCMILGYLLNAELSAQSRMDSILNSDDYFLFLEDSTILRKDQYTRQKGLRYYDLDGEKINLLDVRFLQNEDGFLGFYKSQTVFGQKTYDSVKRILSGSISVFYSTEYFYNHTGNYSNKSSTYYYSKNFSKIKYLNLKNLEADMDLDRADKKNQSIQIHLDRIVKKKKRKKNQLIVGGAAFLVGSIVFSSVEENSSLYYGGVGLALLGVGTGALAFTIDDGEDFQNAIEAYNKIY